MFCVSLIQKMYIVTRKIVQIRSQAVHVQEIEERSKKQHQSRNERKQQR